MYVCLIDLHETLSTTIHILSYACIYKLMMQSDVIMQYDENSYFLQLSSPSNSIGHALLSRISYNFELNFTYKSPLDTFNLVNWPFRSVCPVRNGGREMSIRVFENPFRRYILAYIFIIEALTMYGMPKGGHLQRQLKLNCISSCALWTMVQQKAKCSKSTSHSSSV